MRLNNAATLRHMYRAYEGKQPCRAIGRTVLVKENDIERAMKHLNGIMDSEGMITRYNLTRRYEKPTWARNRINYERSKAIYEEDMRNRISLITKKLRVEPYPGV